MIQLLQLIGFKKKELLEDSIEKEKKNIFRSVENLRSSQLKVIKHKICTICGNEFNTYNLRQTCSRKCWDKLNSINCLGRTAWNKGRPMEEWLGKEKTQKVKEHNSKQLKGKPSLYKGKKHSKEARQKLRIARMKQKITFKDTLIERILQKELKNRNIQFKKHQPILNITLPDILFPEKKIAIYADGDYWHNLPKRKKQDAKINACLIENGWKVLRFWEHDIKNNLEKCMYKIEEELN